MWFRADLRVADNPALTSAVERGAPVFAVYILDEVSTGTRPLGAASKWWLHRSLDSLRRDLDRLDISLVLRRGAAGEVMTSLHADVGAGAVVWNRRYGGTEVRLDGELMRQLREQGCEVRSVAASLLFEPWGIRTGQDTPYSIFTPFWRACRAAPGTWFPLPVPRTVTGNTRRPQAAVRRPRRVEIAADHA